jgi:hypothetical protein
MDEDVRRSPPSLLLAEAVKSTFVLLADSELKNVSIDRAESMNSRGMKLEADEEDEHDEDDMDEGEEADVVYGSDGAVPYAEENRMLV